MNDVKTELVLRVSPPDGPPEERALDGDELFIGRSSDCDVAISDRFLSRRHARLLRRDGEWLVEDLGSRNGTLVNGVPIEEARTVGAGDEIRLSGSTLQLHHRATLSGDAHDGSLGGHTIFRPASELIQDSTGSGVGATASAEELRGYADRLRLLNDVHRALAASLALDELLELILNAAFEHLSPEEAVIFLRDADGEYQRVADRLTTDQDGGHLCSRTLVREVAEKGLAALVLDAETDERFGQAQSLLVSGVRSLVAAPLADSEGSLGMIALSSRLHRRQFSEQDMELLVSLAAVAALRVRNLALAEEAAERRRMARELDLARQIQVALLPDSLPGPAGYELHGHNVPSRGVSGDIYLVRERGPSDGLLLLVADVSGKGMAASLLTASFEALAAGPIDEGLGAGDILERVNHLLHRRTLASKYVTVFVASVEIESGELAYANGGHNPGVLVRAGGEIERLGATGTPVGLLPEAVYGTERVALAPGDTLVLYTDGITEAEDAQDEEFGLERLEAICRDHRKAPLAELTAAIESGLGEFVGERVPADDRTLVLLRRSSA